MRPRTRLLIALIVAVLVQARAEQARPLHGQAAAGGAVQTPEQFFGFKLGTDGELARYPKVLEYMQHLAKTTNRVKYQELGKTTMGNSSALVTISSPENLAKLDRLVEINRRLSDPRGLSPAEAQKLIAEGRTFYLLYATIHSTEVGNGQSINIIAHRLATDASPATKEILDNTVVLLVPSANPDGQVLVIDHWYKTKGTPFNRTYPDLYHKYVGHDDNRDWFMFTQKETRLMIEKVQNAYKPHITHDMHQMGSTSSRIFMPPFDEPYDPNIHPILGREQAEIGAAMASALVSEGKEGVEFLQRYDLWTPARQYMVYHGQPRILTEIASVNIADPFVNPAGREKPLGPQEARVNYPVPYTKGEWRLSQIVDYGVSAAMAGISHVSKYRTTWLENFYKVHQDWVSWKGKPYAFVIPADQRDPLSTYEMLEIMKIADVEIHQATAPFTAGGKNYPAGSHVIKLAQPYGAFAKTMFEKQVYPDLRMFPGGPPKPPYDVTGHTLWMLMGVTVDAVDQPFDASLQLVKDLKPTASPMPARPKWAYVFGPESNAGFKAVAKLQRANVPIFRAAKDAQVNGKTYAPGTWIVPASDQSTRVLDEMARQTGLQVAGADRALSVDAYRLKPNTRIGLWKAANNMPAGWMWWLFEQYDLNHQLVSSKDFAGDLSAKYDTIVLPSGTSRERIVRGLDPKANDKAEWEWAYGVGEAGWTKLRDWVKNGGTLVAVGTATETARELLDLPIEKVLPEVVRRRGEGGRPSIGSRQAAGADAALRDAFSSPAKLIATLRDRVVDPESLFYCPGSLLKNEFDTRHPVGFGMPAEWPVFFETNQAYRIKPDFESQAHVVARYPAKGPVLASGWLLGEEFLLDQANVVAFKVGKGYVVTLASEVDYRTQPRATFKLLFNAMFHGPSKEVSAAQLAKLAPLATN